MYLKKVSNNKCNNKNNNKNSNHLIKNIIKKKIKLSNLLKINLKSYKFLVIVFLFFIYHKLGLFLI